MNSQTPSWESKIDEIIDDKLTEEGVEQLEELLTPGETWLKLNKVLSIANHPSIRPRLEDNELPASLEEKLNEALQAILPMLGTRGYGPLSNHIDKASRIYSAEKEKFEIVSKKVSELEDEEQQVAILRRYLETEPAPLFSSKLRSQYPHRLEKAEKSSRRNRGAIDVSEPLLELLTSPSNNADELDKELKKYTQTQPLSQASLQKGLKTGTVEQKLTGAAIALYRADQQYAPFILEGAIKVDEYGPHLAVIGSLLMPTMAKNIFSQFLTEASITDPEKPEAKAFAGKEDTILALRTLLPKLDSPLEAVNPEDIPEHIDDTSIREIPSKIEHLWSHYKAIRGEGS